MNREHARRVYFEQIKRVVPLSAILERFGILPELKRVGTQLKGCCPIHRGSNPRQFVVDLNKNVWHCFSPQCDRGGGVFEFVSELENVGIEEAARRVGEWFAVALPSQKHSTDTQRRKAMSGERPSYKVFAVEDKGDDDKEAWWTRIGSAWDFTSKAGRNGLSVQLQALPINNRLVLMEYTEEDATEDEKRSAKRRK